MVTKLLPFKVCGDFYRCSRAANSAFRGLIWPNFEPIQDFMVFLVTCKNEEDPIKNEGGRVVTLLFIDLSDAQGQPKLVSHWDASNLRLFRD